ncbi:MAG: c-type cytochrome [Deferribacteres bacterium]|nr:c-type cytochrome [Deferribacteres bacterium]
MYRKFYLTLTLISALVVLAFALLAAYREATPEWKTYRSEYRKLFIEKAEAAGKEAVLPDMDIQQIYLPELQRVDRCTNCHAGVDNPLMADAEIPYRQHSGDYLQNHPVERFGCTVCHQGQGRATNKKEAHGEGRDTHWDYPIIPLKYIQSSCAVCHDLDMLERSGADKVAEGARLFRQKGCKGCHKLNGVGGVLGKYLDGVGSQPIAYFPMKYIKGEKTVYSWLRQHFEDPRSIVPGSLMKVNLTAGEADLLTTYMLSLRSEEMPARYRRIRHAGAEETPDGESLYRMYCIACHTTGKKSVYDSIFKRTIPAIMDPAFLRTANDLFLKRVIKEGRTGTPMTAWKAGGAGLTDEEINRIISYITRDRPASAGQAARGIITAKRITGDIPLQPADALWRRAQEFTVPLMLVGQAPDPMDRLVRVRALYNDRDIAFLVEWEDETRDVSLGVNTFRDGVALQFPVQNTVEPSFRMGQGKGRDSRGMVNIWFWKADVQESLDRGGRKAGLSPVENLTATGFGTLKLKEDASVPVYGRGQWLNGRWRVVFRRAFSGHEGDAVFTAGVLTPVSFAVWDGAEENVDGKKAVSAWYYIVPGR